MKKLLSILFLLVAAASQAFADDTIRHGQPPYMYNPLDSVYMEPVGCSVTNYPNGFGTFRQLQSIYDNLCVHIALRYISPSGGTLVYGMAGVGMFDEPCKTDDDDPLADFFYYLIQLENGNLFFVDTIQMKSYPSTRHYETSYQNYSGTHTRYPLVYEGYFDHPIWVHDTFFLAAGREYDPQAPPYADYLSIHLFTIAEGGYAPSQELVITQYSSQDYTISYGEEYAPGGLFPIIEAPVPDEIVCGAPDDMYVAMRDASSVTLAWHPWGGATDGQNLWELSVGPEGNGPEDNEVFNPGSTYTRLTNLQPGVRYMAYVRGQCHHHCALHDTTLWSEWSDGFPFYLSEDTTGILEARESPIGLSPNPAGNRLAVDMPVPDDYQLKVYDMDGKCLMRRHFNDTHTMLDVSCLPAGVYLIKVKGHNGSYNGKFIKK